MENRRFTATLRQEGDSVLVDLAGDVNAFAADDLDRATEEALAAAPQRLILNFAATDFINSTGIALIVGALGRARAARVHVVACGLSDHYREIFEITRLADYMDIAADEAAALAVTTVFGVDRQGGSADA